VKVSTIYKKRALAVRILLTTAIVALPVFAQAGVFSGIFGSSAEAEYVEEVVQPNHSIQTVALLNGKANPNPNLSHGGGDILIAEDGTMVPALGPNGLSKSDRNKENYGEISQYVVRPADSLSGIAEMFGVSVNTILWANDIKNPNTIQPGHTLVILPVSGVRHVVKKGDTLKAIAQKYHGDMEDIVIYNRLARAEELVPGSTVVVPGGEVPPPPVSKKATITKGGGSGKGGGASLSGYFAHPAPGAKRSQGIHGYNGVDLAGPEGTAVSASAAGQVILARSSGYNGGYGSYIVIKHSNGTQTLYAHLSSVGVSSGDIVSQGQVIGGMGNTGRSTGSHLHFEVRGAKNPF